MAGCSQLDQRDWRNFRYNSELDEKGETIIIYPPEEGYVGYEYTLYITTNIKRKDERELVKGIKM